MKELGFYLITCGPVAGILLVVIGGIIELFNRKTAKKIGGKIALTGVIILVLSLVIGFSICSMTS